jgi:hypothetical protein
LMEAFSPHKRAHSDIFGEVSTPVAKAILRGREEIGVDVIVDSKA